VRVISRVRQVLGVEVPLGEVFARPVLGDFARELETAARAELPPVERAPREGPIPLSFAQQRLWFLDQLEPLNPLYNISYVTRMSGQLDIDALEESLRAVVRRHESLRTTFQVVDDETNPDQRAAHEGTPSRRSGRQGGSHASVRRPTSGDRWCELRVGQGMPT